jgi:hypothetical protein
MSPNQIREWWEFFAQAPLSIVLLAVNLTILYGLVKFVIHIVREIRATMDLNSTLRSDLMLTIKRQETYIEELEDLVEDYRNQLKGRKNATDESTRSQFDKAP